MSATNHTTTIGLSQYISTDKPTYLSDYNGDMLQIDNAIAADRDSIATAQNKADTADGKADTNKGSIDTLNAQINGDPEDPSDTGLAGKVTDNSGDIDTIEALLGNGAPTTSNQTVIGAINGLEGAIAPREDGADLANSYAVGEQFARGGSVYTALVPLTAGTAFASLTLNTDYKNSDTLVEQIASVNGAITSLESALDDDYIITALNESVEVTADGVKTHAQLIAEAAALVSALIANLNEGEFISPYGIVGAITGGVSPIYAGFFDGNTEHFDIRFAGTLSTGSGIEIRTVRLTDTAANCNHRVVGIDTSGTVTYTDKDSSVATSGQKLEVNFHKYKKF